MPGTTMVHAAAPGSYAAIDEALDSILFLDSYRKDSREYDDGTVVAVTDYDGYPTARYEVDGCEVVLEGHLYQTDDAAAALGRLVESVRADDVEAMQEWAATCDGDFVVTVREPDGTVTVLNDVFCRLPVFYATVGASVVVSRELKFVREFGRRRGEPFALDPIGVGQHLCFRYCLGDRTLFEGVHRLEPGAVLRVADGEADVLATHTHDFERSAHADRSVEENAAELESLLLEACEARAARDRVSAVALSGGLDSRAVIAGYHRVGANLVAVTSTVEGSKRDETPVARKVAAALDVDCTTYRLDPPDRYRSRLLDMVQGMNTLQMYPALEFCESIRADYGAATLVTGDGSWPLKDRRPARGFDSVDDLAHFLIEEKGAFPLETAAAVAGIEPEVLLGTIRERIESYPESSLQQKFVHFLVRERGMNWANMGEERTRKFLWSSTPLYSLPFFEYALNCPDEQKRGEGLYRELLVRLSKPLADIEYVDFGAPITSLEYKVKKAVYDEIGRFPALKKTVVKLLSGGSQAVDDEVAELLVDQLARVEEFEGLRRRPIEHVAENPSEYPTYGLYELYTLTSVVVATPAMPPAQAAADGGRPPE